MPTVVALSCPVCGGPLKPPADTCAYCGSFVFIKSDLPTLDRHVLNQAVIQEHIVSLRRRVRTDAFDEDAHYGLGVAYYNLGLLDAAEDELGEAARLMPENPQIHAQLAVVLRDKVRSGERQARERLLKRITTTLRLDPVNIDALALLAEDHARQGETVEADALLERIAQVDAGRAPHARETIWIAQAERSIARDEWMQARPLVLRLVASNAGEAQRLVAAFLSRSRRALPLRLVDPAFRRQAIRNARYIRYGAALAAAVLGVIIVAATDHPAVILAALAGIALLPTLAVWRFGKWATAKERASAIEIGPDHLDPGRRDIENLIAKADALARYRRGELLDLDRLVPLSLSGTRAKPRL